MPFQALISRLEKNRGMKPEERANIMKTLKELTEKITQLQNEMNLASQVSSAKTNHSQPKTKTDVSLASFLSLYVTESRGGKYGPKIISHIGRVVYLPFFTLHRSFLKRHFFT